MSRSMMLVTKFLPPMKPRWAEWTSVRATADSLALIAEEMILLQVCFRARGRVSDAVRTAPRMATQTKNVTSHPLGNKESEGGA